MWKVQYKSHNASQTWATHGSYGSEQSALGNASRISERYFMVRVVDPNGRVVWSS
jgi:hypothetical protein